MRTKQYYNNSVWVGGVGGEKEKEKRISQESGSNIIVCFVLA